MASNLTPDGEHVPVIVVTGPVGVGKSTIAAAIAERLQVLGLPHALVDLDFLRWCYPRPPGDPFHTALGYSNLAAVWRNCREAGARWLIIADVVEERAALADYHAAIPGAQITIVRLRAPLAVIFERIEHRNTGATPEWDRDRAGVLVAQMERDKVEDFAVETTDRSPEEIALEILARTGW